MLDIAKNLAYLRQQLHNFQILRYAQHDKNDLLVCGKPICSKYKMVLLKFMRSICKQYLQRCHLFPR
jgi:hypothetical protein